MHALNTYLLERHGQQRQVVVRGRVPGHADPDAGRGPSAFQPRDPHHKLLQIVLFGQPELDENLRQPQIRQLRSASPTASPLLPLDKDDVKAYLTFACRRLVITGQTCSAGE